MHITRFTDYSLRVLMYLVTQDEELSTIRDIAESYGISKNHLMKVVQELSAKGYIESIRGKNGGIRLKTPPEEINIGRLVRAFESEHPVVECEGENNQCVITPSCQLKRVFGEAMESFFSSLDHYTLADIMPPKAQEGFRRLLEIDNIEQA